jgi:hypothetical protein
MWHGNLNSNASSSRRFAFGDWTGPAAILAFWSVIGATGAESPSNLEFFEKRVRPVLIERCYECHSATARKLKGGLLLDSKAGWSKGGDSGPALVPGSPEKSLLIKAVRWAEEDTQMPPKNKLPEAEIATLVEWVNRGAPDPREGTTSTLPSQSTQAHSGTNHWAYQPVKSEAPPVVKDREWPKGDIDRFVLAQIEANELKPAPDAEAAVLCRRLYFDLVGLPPTPEELNAFSRSARRDPKLAVESLVDRLLGMPQFGEHWARHWFDVARFAESVTLRGFIFKEAWRYRDYVIDSCNRDVPFDQFVREQIAGDLLPRRDIEQARRQKIATAFLTVGNWNLEEQDKKQLDMDVVDEQLDTIGKAFLGQTIGCARCHDHKFDPIPTRDYYAMAGILRNVRTLKHANVSEWLEAPLPVQPDHEKRLAAHEAELATLRAELNTAKEAAKALAGKSAEAKSSADKTSVVSASALGGMVVDSAKARAVGEWKHSTYSKHYIGDGYLHDLDQGKGTKTLSFAPELARPGLYEVRLAYIHAPSRATNVPVTIFHADGETVATVNQQEAPVVDGRFVSLGQFRFEANGFANVLIGTDGTKGFVTADAVQFVPQDGTDDDKRLPSNRSRSVDVKAGARTGDQNLPASAAPNPTDIKALEARLKKLQESGPKRPMTMAVEEQEKIEDIPIHVRGSVHNLGPVVPRGFLAVASPGPAPELPANQSGRREFADWIASAENPLTARVYVNRLWCWLFGEGLVRSMDNFGTTGEAPSHPQLLDYLATRLVAEGWSTKRLIREIILSRTYQQASTRRQPKPGTRNEDSRLASPASPEDVENRLLARANRRRLTAEQLRDAMLAVSGTLNLESGGKTYPADRTADFGFVFHEPRRSVYAPVFRNALPEIFEAFDFAPPSMVTGRRSVSTVPTQALFLLNHPFVREQAQAAARRLLAGPDRDDPSRLNRAYQLTLGRSPSKQERALARSHIAAMSDSAGGREEAWTELFHALFASADFRYLD